jgi:hypothetical protein
MFFLSSKYLLKNTVIVHVIFVFLHPCTSGATTSHKIPPPRKCTFDGYFHDALAKTVQPCPGFLPCPKGFYCKDGNKIPCPAGTFGREEKNSNKACSGICPGGFYCPQGT